MLPPALAGFLQSQYLRGYRPCFCRLHNRQIIPGIQRTAGYCVTFRCCCDFDFWVVSDRLTPIAFGHRLRWPLPQPVRPAHQTVLFCGLQDFQTAVTALLRLLCTVTALLMALPTVPERATVSPLSSAQIFRPQYDGHAPGQPPPVTGNADIPVRNHIRTADMSCLPAVILTLPAVEPMVLALCSALSRPRAGHALSYCCQW